jgi:tetratricopeptide (TPR) repeat protein
LAPQNAIAHFVRCQVFFDSGHHPEAIDACETSIALDRNYAPAYGFLAAMVRLNGQPERAVELLQRATLLSPRDPKLWMWLQFLGRAQSDLGRQDEAIMNFRKAIAVNPGAPPFQWTLLSTAYARAKRYAEAREAMDTFLRLSPGLMVGKPDDVVRAMKLQIQLALRGYYLGIIDGDIGRQTRRALASYQREEGFPVTEQADDETLNRLGLATTQPELKQ